MEPAVEPGRVGSDERVRALHEEAFVRLDAEDTQRLIGAGAMASWDGFAASWEDLGDDRYMADGGRYRRRRYAAFARKGAGLVRKAHQPHYQSRDYNPLNGDVQRWFAPVSETIAAHPVTQAIFALCLQSIDAASGHEAGHAVPWQVEFHQFRIEASSGEAGRPTPEGMHRDGVDWVFVMLVRRENVRDGVTEIGDADGAPLGRFLLQAPGDAVLLDDRRIRHGVTEIHPLDPERPAFRDVLVVTFAAP
ncbi:2OG-Fe dioxygenase family protein [Novosphingobium sp. 1949]|uniref:2OG-Fe dioxygenase family protein n=1 Tax=Novosphingobium organovorum TaxID=2930092 RepID=A0ABT0BDX9_9SPHN|nr:2OG-Fe dioxygenase family protein [Novosphingobium organovorum]MCJ2183276.1 2OG-Fe dioxygenase family protein [Novosphingobium organovorum]